MRRYITYRATTIASPNNLPATLRRDGTLANTRRLRQPLSRKDELRPEAIISAVIGDSHEPYGAILDIHSIVSHSRYVRSLATIIFTLALTRQPSVPDKGRQLVGAAALVPDAASA